MNRGNPLPLRNAVLSRLRSDGGVACLVDPTSIYPGTAPAAAPWPYVCWGVPVSSPIDGACIRGADTSFTVHVFAANVKLNGEFIETGEDRAAKLGGAISAALDGLRLTLEGGRKVKIHWQTGTLMRDGSEASAWHSVQTFRARML